MSPPRYGSSEHVVVGEGIGQPRPRFQNVMSSSPPERRSRRDTNASVGKTRLHTTSSSTASSVTTSRSFNSSDSRHSSSESFGVRSEGGMLGRGGPTYGGRVRGRPSSSTASRAPKIDEEEVIRRRQERKARSARLLSDLDDRRHHRRSSNDNDGEHKYKSSPESGHHRPAAESSRADEHASISADTTGGGDTKERVRTRSVGSSRSRRRSSVGDDVPSRNHGSRRRSSSASGRRSMDYVPPATRSNDAKSATRRSAETEMNLKASLATRRSRRHSMEQTSSQKSLKSENGPSRSTSSSRTRRRASMEHHFSWSSSAPQKDSSDTTRHASSSQSVRTHSDDAKQEHRSSNGSQRRSSTDTNRNVRVHLRSSRRSTSMGHGTLREQPTANYTGIDPNLAPQVSNRHPQDSTIGDAPRTTSDNSSEEKPMRRHSLDYHRSGHHSSSATAPPDPVSTEDEQPPSETENSSSSSRMLQVLRKASMQHSMSFRRLSTSNHPPPVQEEEDTAHKVERRDSMNSTSSFLSLKEETLPPRTSRHDLNSSFRRASLESEQCEVPPPTAPPQRNRTWSENISSGGAILSRLGQGFRQETETTEEDNSDDISVASARSTNTSSLPSRRTSILSGFMSNLDKEEEVPSSSKSFFAKRKSSLESCGSNFNTTSSASAPCSSTSLPCVVASDDQGEISTDSSRWMLGLKREAASTTAACSSDNNVPDTDEDQSATTSMRILAETSVEKVNEVKQIGANIRQTIRSSIHHMAIPEVGSIYEVDTHFEPSAEKLHRTERGRRRHSSFMDMVTNISSEAEKTTSTSSDSFMSRASQRAAMRARNADPSIGNSSRPTSIVGSDVVGAFAAAAESMRDDKRQRTRNKPPREEMRVFNPNNSKDDLGKELWDSGTFEVVDGLITLAHPDDEGKEHHPVFNFL